jgi:prolyl-tRNA editing enzyme YbaK/EbsC (Cys-tRNA(Pro) deacylase)
MRVAHGTVVSGKVVLDDASLPEGAKVYVLSGESGHLVSLSADELAELEAGLAEADRGETISGQALFDQLRRHG